MHLFIYWVPLLSLCMSCMSYFLLFIQLKSGTLSEYMLVIIFHTRMSYSKMALHTMHMFSVRVHKHNRGIIKRDKRDTGFLPRGSIVN